MATESRPIIKLPEGGNSRDTVLVGCNIPNGLWMECFVPTTVKIPVLGGGERDETQYRADPSWTRIKLNGPAVPWGKHATFDIKSGYAFTSVPKHAWDKWAAQHTDFIASKSVICGETQDAAFGLAKDFKNVRSGLQPLKRKKDPRVKINTRPEVTIEEEGEVVAD